MPGKEGAVLTEPILRAKPSQAPETRGAPRETARGADNVAEYGRSSPQRPPKTRGSSCGRTREPLGRDAPLTGQWSPRELKGVGSGSKRKTMLALSRGFHLCHAQAQALATRQ